MKKFATALAAVAALTAAGTAVAQDYPIAYGDLDLGSVEGARMFDQRVNAAARRACRMSGPALLDNQCRDRFRAEALRLLPESRRQDYARAHGARVMAMVTTVTVV